MQITSLEQYLSEVKKVALSDIETAFPNVYYRGEANVEWKAEASLFRGKIGEDSFYKDVNYTKEGDLIASALIQYPQAFEKCHNAISRLVLMQHYGLPTRLYDVTANPLVALFFACNMEFDKDGKVLFTKPGLGLYSSDFVNILAELNEEIYDNEYEISFARLLLFAQKKNIVPTEGRNSFEKNLFRNLTESFLMQPPMDNDRIRQQKGALIFSSLLKVSETETQERYDQIVQHNSIDDRAQFKFQKYNVDLRYMFSEKEFNIPKSCKKTILKELDMIGINEAFVFPELEHQLRTIKYQNVPQNNWIKN